jgi:diphthamide synthase (EF-2-diphthine--ammonia ligase)
MREDPVEGETVRLVVTAVDEDGADALAADLAGLGEDVERLEYGAVAVTVAQENIESVCELDGVESIETEDAVGIGGDAGEDV